jgi:hypothetical protein
MTGTLPPVAAGRLLQHVRCEARARTTDTRTRVSVPVMIVAATWNPASADGPVTAGVPNTVVTIAIPADRNDPPRTE